MARSLRKLSKKDLLVKISAPDLLDYQNEHHATTRAIWQAQSDERVAWGASHLKMSTVPQPERSDTHIVTRRLREHMLDFHKTLRAPRKMNIEKVTDVLPGSQPLFCQGPRSNYCACHKKCIIIIMPQIKSDDNFTKRAFHPFQSIVQVYQTLRLPRKMTSKSTPHFTHGSQAS